MFQYLAQEAVSICTAALKRCATIVAKRNSEQSEDIGERHALLFLVKHLLVLREQISPFQVDFSVTEKALDFTHIRGVIPGLFAGTAGGWHGLVEQSAPRLTSSTVDSKEDMEAELKQSCERLIASQTQTLVGPLLAKLTSMAGADAKPPSAATVAELVKAAAQAKDVGARATAMLRETHLYLANPVTEKILFRPLKRTLEDVTVQLEQVSQGLASEELARVCPDLKQQVAGLHVGGAAH